MKPSDNWINNLILIIQECNAENGKGFGAFVHETFKGLQWNTTDYDLVQRLKERYDIEGRQRAALSDMHPEVESQEPFGFVHHGLGTHFRGDGCYKPKKA